MGIASSAKCSDTGVARAIGRQIDESCGYRPALGPIGTLVLWRWKDGNLKLETVETGVLPESAGH